MTYPLQSEVSPTFRRFQGLVSCLVFSSKFTSSWGGKRKGPINTRAHLTKSQGTDTHKSWVRTQLQAGSAWGTQPSHGNSVFLLLAAPCSAMLTARHIVLLHFPVSEGPSKGW